MRETWYVLEDGRCVDPAEVAPGDDGALVHEDGRKVAYGPHGPRSRSIIPDEERAKVTTREQVAEKPKTGYKTRSMKAD